MKYLVVIFWYFFFQEATVPYKSAEEFQLNVDLNFKEKPPEYRQNTFTVSGERLDKTSAVNQAFITIIITKIKILPDESRIIVVDSNGRTLVKKKTPIKVNLQFEMGFVDDLKKKVTPNEITIYFLSEDKTKLRKIVASIQDDGTFQVNGNWRGKF